MDSLRHGKIYSKPNSQCRFRHEYTAATTHSNTSIRGKSCRKFKEQVVQAKFILNNTNLDTVSSEISPKTILSSGKSSVFSIINEPKVVSSSSDKAKLFAIYFASNSTTILYKCTLKNRDDQSLAADLSVDLSLTA